jgi:dienelactone hydrolase
MQPLASAFEASSIVFPGMSGPMTIRSRLIYGVLLSTLVALSANAQYRASTEQMSFMVVDAFERGAAVSGELRLPASLHDRLPAVLILHSNPGFDGRGAFYADALNQAGIATLEIDYLRGKGFPTTPRHNLPHAYETLKYLAEHARIDPTRIGIMGFSWGGIISVLTSSEELTQQYTGGKLRFAAHLGLYPLCWRHRAILAGTSNLFKPAIYHRVTGRPVHILAGEMDDYDDDPQACQKFVSELPARVRRHISVTIYPGATFGWDSRVSSAQYDIGIKKGTGGIAKIVADAEIANRSREFVVAFFRKSLSED